MKRGPNALWVLALGMLSFLLPGCQADANRKPQDRVEEIPIAGSFSNADLIRNPVSATSRSGSVKQVAMISFRDSLAVFGEVEEGVLVERQFEFTNAGKSPLVISRAYSTCGCTVPEWPEAPILPGEKGTLRVRFDTRGKVGEQYKPVYITANTLPATSKVYLIGEVIPGKK
ncbi:MAG: DUF1573 domain-containing protein [Haliscomenobacter sp.]|nr:DUF1573 domain-containing protein [Haliscomenobacter sp.]MBK8877738.1 DUF1573 domain-containing protein [Haliscomenobacter sp.]